MQVWHTLCFALVAPPRPTTGAFRKDGATMNAVLSNPADTIYETGTILTVKVLKVRYHGNVTEQQVLEYLCPLRAPEYARFHLLLNLQRLHIVHLNFLDGLVELARIRRTMGKLTYVCGLSPENERLLHLLDPIDTLHVCHSYQEAFAALGMEQPGHHGKTSRVWTKLLGFLHKPEKMAAACLILFAILVWSYRLS
jgi:hypothetical protein